MVKVRRGEKHCLLSHKGKNLGCFDTKEGVNKRERQVKFFKKKGKKK